MSIFNRTFQRIAKVGILSKYLFKDAEQIIAQEKAAGIIEELQAMTPIEVASLHFNYGMYLRNKYRLWNPYNPHTMQKYASQSDESKPASEFHPDNYSWSIISRLLVELGEGQTTLPFAAEAASEYALLLTDVDSIESHKSLRDYISKLIAAERFRVIGRVFDNAIRLHASPVKLRLLIESVEGFEDKIEQHAYDKIVRVANRFGAKEPE